MAAFYSSAKGLQDGDAVPVIAVTGTAANVAGIVGGFIVFGDPLPGSPLPLIVQCFAFVLVLGAAWLMPAPVRAARRRSVRRRRRVACPDSGAAPAASGAGQRHRLSDGLTVPTDAGAQRPILRIG